VLRRKFVPEREEVAGGWRRLHNEELYGLNSSGLGKGPVAGSCEHGNEHLGFIKGREFLDQLNDR
jgi:hypothetical protein